MTKEKLTAFRLAESDYAKLGKIARRLDRSLSWTLRDAVKAYIKAAEQSAENGTK
jgi:predicted transcriptional regulator